MSFDEKKYHIDGEPVSATEIIQRARDLDAEYDAAFMQSTSRGAAILRREGHTVGEITELEATISTD